MKGFLFLLPLAFLPSAGSLARLLPGERDRAPGARFAIRVATGAVVLALAMLAATIFGLPWKLSWLAALAILPAALPGRRKDPPPAPTAGFASPEARFGLVATTAAICLVAYAAATARATSSDLYLHWGTKGEKFALARGVDAPFLRDEENFPLHRDYPPLLPFLYAAGYLTAGRFAWGAALLYLPIFLGVSAAAFWGFARRRLGDRIAAELTAVYSWLFGFTLIESLSAGNAEVLLLLFQTLALCVLMIGEDRARDEWLVGIALTGAVLTKFEGAFFAAFAILGTSLFLRRGKDRLTSLARLAALPTAALFAWIGFCARSGCLDSYSGGIRSGPIVLGNFPIVVRELVRAARYESFWLPWLAVGALFLGSKFERKHLMPLGIAGASIAGDLFIFLHGADDPSLWISWSAGRLLLTPLLCLFLTAADATGTTATGSSPESTR